MLYSAKCGLAITCRLSVRLSMTLLDQDHIGWKSWKVIARTISPTSSLFVAQRSSTYSQGNMEKFWGENVRSTPTSIMSGWMESCSAKSHVILGGGVTVCLHWFVYFCQRITRSCLRYHSFLVLHLYWIIPRRYGMGEWTFFLVLANPCCPV